MPLLPGKIRPYEWLSDAELWDLAGQAADLRMRLSALQPGYVAEVMIEHGCRAKDAHAGVNDPHLRGFCARFALDVADAKRGDSEAQARVDHVVHGWEALRRAA